jgi:hypothetical protein
MGMGSELVPGALRSADPDCIQHYFPLLTPYYYLQLELKEYEKQPEYSVITD